jgi:hypothetical protein
LNPHQQVFQAIMIKTDVTMLVTVSQTGSTNHVQLIIFAELIP